MRNTYEMFKGGLLTQIEINDLEVGDLVQLRFHRELRDESSGKEIINTTQEFYFTPSELKNFFQPIINDLYVRFENADSVQK